MFFWSRNQVYQVGERFWFKFPCMQIAEIDWYKKVQIVDTYIDFDI